MPILGDFLRGFVGGAVDIFYRRRVVDGTIPTTGPVLLVANHPNALLDPMVVQRSAGRRVRMLAKAPLFTMPGISILVKGLDCLPVYRAKDGADTSANAATFAAVSEALVAGDCVLIFPEGISHDEPSVQRLKTGAARMAIQGWRAGAKDLVVIPVGLVYADKLRYRSTAAVDIGAPIAVGDFVAVGDGPVAATDAADAADAANAVDAKNAENAENAENGENTENAENAENADRAAAVALTDAIARGLAKETVNLESWEDLRLLDAVDAIWRQQDPERARRIKSLADGVALLREHRSEDFDAFRARLSLWVDRMAALGLAPRDLGEVHLSASQQPARAAAFVARNVVAGVFGLPLAVFGAVFWAAPFWLVHTIYVVMRPERDTGATVKILGGMLFFPLWWLASVVVVGVFGSWWLAVLLAVVAPGAGLTSRHFFRRRSFALRQLLGVVSLWTKGRLGRDARRERDALCAELDGFGAWVEAHEKPRQGGGAF